MKVTPSHDDLDFMIDPHDPLYSRRVYPSKEGAA